MNILSLHFGGLALLLSCSGFFSLPAVAQVTCIQQYAASAPEQPLAFAPTEIDRLVAQVSESIGLSAIGIRAVPCAGIGNGNVMAISYFNRTDVPKGDYILYDPTWVQQVIGIAIAANSGRTHDQAIVLFGHELGHLLGRHFTSRADLSRLEKETEADRFAGCAAGSMNVRWENVSDLLERLRGSVDTTYPSREHSLVVAREGFDHCARRLPLPERPAENAGTAPIQAQDRRLQAILSDLTSEKTTIRRDARRTLVQFLSQSPADQVGAITGQLIQSLSRSQNYRYQLGVSVALAGMPGGIPVRNLSESKAQIDGALRARAGADPTLRTNLRNVMSKLIQA